MQNLLMARKSTRVACINRTRQRIESLEITARSYTDHMRHLMEIDIEKERGILAKLEEVHAANS